jgi:hypothetical protein
MPVPPRALDILHRLSISHKLIDVSGAPNFVQALWTLPAGGSHKVPRLNLALEAFNPYQTDGGLATLLGRVAALLII